MYSLITIYLRRRLYMPSGFVNPFIVVAWLVLLQAKACNKSYGNACIGRCIFVSFWYQQKAYIVGNEKQGIESTLYVPVCGATAIAWGGIGSTSSQQLIDHLKVNVIFFYYFPSSLVTSVSQFTVDPFYYIRLAFPSVEGLPPELEHLCRHCLAMCTGSEHTHVIHGWLYQV